MNFYSNQGTHGIW